MRNFLTIFFFLATNLIYSQNLSTLGPYLKDDNSNNVILRGINLGGWMLQEPYLFQFTGAADSQHEFKEKLVEFIGQENTDNFYNAWYESFITQGDVDSLASHGYNSIRLPMHYNLFTLPIQEEPNSGENTWLEEGFEIIDDILGENDVWILPTCPAGLAFDLNHLHNSKEVQEVFRQKKDQHLF